MLLCECGGGALWGLNVIPICSDGLKFRAVFYCRDQGLEVFSSWDNNCGVRSFVNLKTLEAVVADIYSW